MRARQLWRQLADRVERVRTSRQWDLTWYRRHVGSCCADHFFSRERTDGLPWTPRRSPVRPRQTSAA